MFRNRGNFGRKVTKSTVYEGGGEEYREVGGDGKWGVGKFPRIFGNITGNFNMTLCK